jgi:L-aspartate oxidase
MQKADFLVIGSGIAGLSYALKVAEHFQGKEALSIHILTKANKDETNTKYAQGGIAAVTNQPADSFDKHVQDTLLCGDGLCDEEIVRMVVEEGPQRVEEIIRWGTRFDKAEDGAYDLAKEGGHSEHRIMHHKDITGWEIERALLAKVSQYAKIHIHAHYFAVDLITQHHLGQAVSRKGAVECYGVYALNLKTGEMETFLARSVLLAAGGMGSIYQATTNPAIATGDGLAMAYRARAEIKGLEFVQFHPTALYNPGEYPSFLITEAVRGFGGKLKNKAGEEFVYQADKRGSLASRDIVARAIDAELKKTGDTHVYLDVRGLPMKEFKQHFPNITEKCQSLGIDVEHQQIPVVPAAHYSCGGVSVDKDGLSTIKNLYACGECAHTGLHGANRLASNSLLEALVFSHRAFEHALKHSAKDFCEAVPAWNAEGKHKPAEMFLISQNREELQEIMSRYVGIVRSDRRLKRALRRIALIYQEVESMYNECIPSIELMELRNMSNVAYLIAEAALHQKENRGLHYSIDNE